MPVVAGDRAEARDQRLDPGVPLGPQHGVVARSSPIVPCTVPAGAAAAQKLPKPWVGCSPTSSSRAPSWRALSHWARPIIRLSSGSTRSVRPTVPCSRLPPEKTRAGAGLGVGHQEGLVVQGVAGRGQHLHDAGGRPRGCPRRAPRCASNCDALVGRQPVVRAVAPGQRGGAGDVVVVHVGVGHGDDAHPGLLGRQLDRTPVPRAGRPRAACLPSWTRWARFPSSGISTTMTSMALPPVKVY